jgi:protoporphyrinogen oxidase
MGTTGKILILGGGPAGLGAAWRLQEVGGADWLLLEKDDHVGGLASSHVDENGFTWDLGGHVVFSHYRYFDDLLDSLLDGQWVAREREAWVWMRDRFIPYPLQNNIRHLPTPELIECIEGLLDTQKAALREEGSATFADWIVRRFGPGLARVFLTPYNTKVWATDPARMSCSWVGERVATVDLKRILRNVLEGRDDRGWGPNATFRFPLHGGTGRIWQTLAARLSADRLRLGAEVTAVDGRHKTVHLRDGSTLPYDWLITTMPLDNLLPRLADSVGSDAVRRFSCRGRPALESRAGSPRHTTQCPYGHTTNLRYSSTHVIGVGLAGAVPEHLATKCWMYFPEPQVPFYRVTVFSNYSPHHVPQPGRQWSLLAEVSESADRPAEQARVVEQTIAGLTAARLLEPGTAIESVWHRRLEHGYPVPTLDRDPWLDRIEPVLRSMNILSRGRFGAWKYEVGNMDHSFMQGVEAVNHILLGTPETTLRFPDVVNGQRPSSRRSLS